MLLAALSHIIGLVITAAVIFLLLKAGIKTFQITQDRTRLLLNLGTIFITTYTAVYTTFFITDDTIPNLEFGTVMILLFLYLNLVVPIGYLLLFSLLKSYKIHYWLGIICTLFVALPLFAIFAGTIHISIESMTVTSSIVLLLLIGNTLHRLHIKKWYLLIKPAQTVLALFIGMIGGFVINDILNNFDQYQQVAEYASSQVPDAHSSDAPPATIFVSAWIGFIMIIAYSLFDLIQPRRRTIPIDK
jgi:hypothetical protein